MMHIIFYVSLALLAYAYWLYPLILMCLPNGKGKRSLRETANSWPFVSLILSVYNEADVIESRLKNFLASEYAGRCELVVISDGSSDRTAELAAPFAGERIRLIVQGERTGKGAAINRAIEAARGEILAFTDANTYFAPDTLTELVRPFSDPSVGLVTGSTRYSEGTIGSLYQRYEQFLKGLESRGGVVATADGAVYAMRRSLWQPHDPRLINDFYHPMLVNLQGMRAVIADGAICREDFAVNGEFARQVRMVAQASLVYCKVIPRLLRARCWRSVLVLTSHKLIRWLTIPLLTFLLISSIASVYSGGVFIAVLAAQLIFGVLVAAGAVVRLAGGSERLAIAYHFIALNWAATLGLWRALMGAVPLTWQPRGD